MSQKQDLFTEHTMRIFQVYELLHPYRSQVQPPKLSSLYHPWHSHQFLVVSTKIASGRRGQKE
jgi:hypothetical protein